MPKSIKADYIFPEGYPAITSLWRSAKYLHDPILFITNNMKRYSGSYHVRMPGGINLIVTQDAGFTNYVLKENHANYHKSIFSAKMASRHFGNGLLFSNGGYWLKQRRLIQPGFHANKISSLFDAMDHTVTEALSTFPTGKMIDVYPLVYRLSFSVVIQSLFDIPLSDASQDELSDLFGQLQDYLIKEINQPFRRLFNWASGTDHKMAGYSNRVRETFRRIIHQRLASNTLHHDLLEMLINAQYEDTGERMTEIQLIDEIMVLIFAGHETTANTLSWLLYLIAANPEVQDKLHAISSAEESGDGIKNEYVTAVINEGMRMFPAAWITDRVALSDDAFGPYRYPKGTIVISFFYGMNRDAQQWDQPDQFLPGRFIDEQEKPIKYKYFFPFGSGPRMCIGNGYAMAEMSIFIKHFFNRFKISRSGIDSKTMPLIALRPDKVIVNLERR